MNKYNIKFPIAKKIDNLITLYNDTRNDKFSWIRDSNWPKINDEILDYLKSENEATKQYLDKYQKLQNKIFKELKSRIKETDESYPVKKDNYYYYSRSVKGKNYSIKCRKKDSLKEEEEVIFDANKMSKKHVAFSMSAFSINKNHQLLAYSTDLVGAERYTIYIKNLSTKKTLKDKIEGTIGDIVWHEGLQGFFYTKLEENWRTLKLYFHKLGTDQDDDKLIFEEKDETFRVGIYSSSDDRYMLCLLIHQVVKKTKFGISILRLLILYQSL
jgi:oligopeptidase B